MHQSRKTIAIIGGGISGLVLAYRLERLAAQKKISIQLRLFEKSARVGGIIETVSENGFLVDYGPDAFLSEKKKTQDLCHELGLSNELISTQEQYQKSFILNQNRLEPMPTGIYLGIPSDLKTLLKLPFISPIGKFHALKDYFMPVGARLDDESVGSFMKRRFGSEITENLVQPMIGGIYGTSIDHLSLEATFPRFKQWEAGYGSVMKGLRKSRSLDRAFEAASGPRYSLFLSFRKGMQTLIEALQKSLKQTEIKTHAEIKVIGQNQRGRWKLALSGKETIESDVICLCLPTYQAASMIQPLNSELSELLKGIHYGDIMSVHLGFQKAALPDKHRGFGFVVSSKQKSIFMGCTFSSLKFLGRAPGNDLLVRAFLSHDHFNREDQELIRLIETELRERIGLTGTLVKTWVKRWPQSMPQYQPGHLNKVKQIEERSQKAKGLYLCSNGFYGVGIPDTIGFAELTAAKILNDEY